MSSSSLGRERSLFAGSAQSRDKPEPKTATLPWRWSAPVASNSAAGSERDREKYRDHDFGEVRFAQNKAPQVFLFIINKLVKSRWILSE
jgi:hypothetical protein